MSTALESSLRELSVLLNREFSFLEVYGDVPALMHNVCQREAYGVEDGDALETTLSCILNHLHTCPGEAEK